MFFWRAKPVLSNHLSFMTLFQCSLEGQTCIKQPPIFCDPSISMFPWRAKPVSSNHLSFMTLFQCSLGGPNLYQATTYLLWPHFNVPVEGQTCIKQPPIFCDPSISMFPWRAKPVLSNHLSFVTLFQCSLEGQTCIK